MGATFHLVLYELLQSLSGLLAVCLLAGIGEQTVHP